MKQISDTTIGGRSTSGFSDFSLARVTFDSCYVGLQSVPGELTPFTNLTLTDVSHVNCSIHTSRLERVSLDGLKRVGSSPFFIWGCVFNQVELRGKVSGLKINRAVGAGTMVTPTQQEAWDLATETYYEGVEWALDISNAKFPGGITFEALPGHKVKRNMETQVLVRRDKLNVVDWQKLDFGASGFDIALSWFLDGSQFDSVVLAARTASKHGMQDVAVLDMLRKQELAE
ncbi:hypothetical protein J2W32_000658 [Variovorax boronicumulans]|uniref:Pentapeptide repeat-containing protein n=2 Tax=Variovorax boronicumulans TaxID=436515 RepID=A0AAW8CQG4_9BURK|nr:hypothetical protein [Variovorax boronicumulans]MDP9891561.1 hypothetical protein [Variovorax boronicumulans]MDP9991526.1 hypothetical protein [Variovorax boronicumulans]MDQ0003554.1 hypothetical protein [Variovorax boronicumulans]MDQ0035112.1 hypothetical protein [Variovorax boronicumulans]MDQ0040646.1 hypothetical protein [Variovorax boronicumulans]